MAMNTQSSGLVKSPWHKGELELQKTIGVAERMDDVGRRFIRDHLIEQHRLFYPQLPMLVAGAVDAEENPWATVLVGRPGFLSATDDHTLAISAHRDPTDPADQGMDSGSPIGVLGIELHTRRRNRLNG